MTKRTIVRTLWKPDIPAAPGLMCSMSNVLSYFTFNIWECPLMKSFGGRAIKRATEKDAADYKEVIYEGYGSHGIAFLVETATDNTNRTVANVRMYFNKCGGTLGNSGSVAFMFDHKCVFKFHAAEGADMEELELEMIDLGVDEFYPEEDGVTVYAPYESFGAIQKWLDDKGYEIVSGESVYLPTDTKELDAEGRESIEKLVEKLEEDDDVTNVYHNMKEVDEE